MVGRGAFSTYVELSTAIAVSSGPGPYYSSHYINAYSWHKDVEKMHVSVGMFGD